MTFLGGKLFGPLIAACLIANSIATSCANETLPPPELQLFILAGQSNMSGRGDLKELPADFPENGHRLWNFGNDGRWRKALEPIDSAEGQEFLVSNDPNAGVGPGLAFANTLAEANPHAKIGLIPCARGGSSIDEWKPSADTSTLYGSCLARIVRARNFGTTAAVIWYQGESDAHSLAAVNAWARKFAVLSEAFRRDLQAPGLPIIAVRIGSLGDNRRSDPRFRYWNQLRELQSRLSGRAVAIVDAAGLPTRDGLHLTTDSQLRLGKRLAAAYLKISAE
jgi:hypothetical protein